MNFLRKFKAMNQGALGAIIIGFLALLQLFNVVTTYPNIDNFSIWIMAVLSGAAAVVALVKNRYWLAAFILFFSGYQNHIGTLINQLMLFKFPDIGLLIRNIILALAAAYLILVVIASLFTGTEKVDKKFSSSLVLAVILTALFIYVKNKSFDSMLVMLLPIFVAVLGGVEASASLLLVGVTVQSPANILLYTFKGTWNQHTDQIILLVIGTVLFVFNVIVLVRELTNKRK